MKNISKLPKQEIFCFFCANDGASKFIRWWTRGPFHHVAIVITDPLNEEEVKDGTFKGRVRVLEATAGDILTDFIDSDKRQHHSKESGVVVVDLAELVKIEEKITVRRLTISDAKLRDKVMDAIKESAKESLGTPYSIDHHYINIADTFEAILANFIPALLVPVVKRKHHDSYVCSSFVAHVLMKANIMKSCRDDQLFYPSDFQDKVFKGDQLSSPLIKFSKEIRLNNITNGLKWTED